MSLRHDPHRDNPQSSASRVSRSASFAGTPGVTAARTFPGLRSPRDVLRLLRERWMLGVSAGLLAASALAYFQLSQPSQYEATSTLLFEPTAEQVVNIKSVVDNSLQGSSSEARLQTHVEQINSGAFMNYVIGSFDADEVRKLTQAYVDPERPERPAPSLAGIIRPNLDVRIHRGTFVIGITVSHRDPQSAATIANRYARKYIDYNVDRTSASNQAAILFLRDQADEMKTKVEASENRLQEYRRAHNIVSLEENQNVILQKLTGLTNAVVKARVERLELESRLDHVESYLQHDQPLVQISYISEYGSIPQLMEQLDKLEADRALLEQKYFENHPRLKENLRSTSAVESLLQTNIQLAVTDLRSRYQRALEHEQMMIAEYSQAETDSIGFDGEAVEYRMLKRQAETDHTAYSQIIDRLNEMVIASQLESINIKSVDQADVPTIPASPVRRKVIAQSAFFGIFVMLCLPVGLGMLDNRLKSSWEVEDYLRRTLIGEIPAFEKVQKKDRPHLVSNGRDEAASESFRGLYSQMELNSAVEYPKVMLLTSTLPAEGKTFVANNLAATFAAHGRRTILVDCDFRRPSLHGYYGRRNDAGILRWLKSSPQVPLNGNLADESSLGILQVRPNLSILRTGGESRNPTEFFESPSFRSLFEQLRVHYDIVVVDTPPVGIFPDPLLLSRHCDELLYVCQFNRVNKVHIKKLLHKMDSSDALLSGIIINGVPAGRRSADYDYYGYGTVGNGAYRAYYAMKS